MYIKCEVMKKFVVRCVPSALKSEDCNVGKIIGYRQGWTRRYRSWGNIGELGFSPMFFDSLQQAETFRQAEMAFPEIAEAHEM